MHYDYQQFITVSKTLEKSKAIKADKEGNSNISLAKEEIVIQRKESDTWRRIIFDGRVRQMQIILIIS